MKKSYKLLGDSPAMVKLREMVKAAAHNSDAPVLITGGTGTGKELVARLLHAESTCAHGPFVAYNCASATKELAHSVFFGAERGSFSGAERTTDGLFGAADNGVLFLDEVGEIPIEVQGVLLRVLEEGVRQRVGGTKDIPCNVRVVAATNRDLPKAVVDGRFRADLYERLNMLEIHTPSLKEHREDIPVIVSDWLARHGVTEGLTEFQINALQEYDYPGNVRELVNLLERAKTYGVKDYAALIRDRKNLRGDAATTVNSSDVLKDVIKTRMPGRSSTSVAVMPQRRPRYSASVVTPWLGTCITIEQRLRGI